MQIIHHIHYLRTPEATYRQEFRFQAAVDLPPLIENPDAIYTQKDLTSPGYKGTLRECKPIVSSTGVLQIMEPVDHGSLISFGLLPLEGIKDLVTREGNEILVLLNKDYLTAWLFPEKPGMLCVRATVAQDGGEFLRQVVQASGDLSTMEYLVTQLRPEQRLKKEVLTTAEAAILLGVTPQIVIRWAKNGYFPYGKAKPYRFLRQNLLDFLNGEMKG